ncbi:MAG: hypothetical protein K2W96_23130 [Gemmataceae bacterium]|nr:hypothetical protein [Gemmataceae bacterium]
MAGPMSLDAAHAVVGFSPALPGAEEAAEGWLDRIRPARVPDLEKEREAVAREIRARPDPARSALALVVRGATRGVEVCDRIADVLRLSGPVSLEAARLFLRQDEPAWAALGFLDYRWENNAWHVLLKGMSNSGCRDDSALVLIAQVGRANNRALRMAAADALRDIGRPEARGMLAAMVEGETDPKVLRTIADAVADLEA